MSQNHFTATGLVFNTKNEILMIHHNKLGVWLPPGGHIDENELPDDAVLREILEETGVRAEIISLRRGLELDDSHCRELSAPFTILLEDIEGGWVHNHIDLVYLCRAVTEVLTPQASEVHGIGWFSYEDARRLKTFDNVIKIISLAVKYIEESRENKQK